MIVSVYAKNTFTAVITESGKLYSFGRIVDPEDDNDGDIGDQARDYLIPRLNTLLQERILSVSIGSNHMVLITESGMYSYGANYNGQLGTGDTVDRLEPTLIDFPQDVIRLRRLRRIRAVSAGWFHTTVLTDNEEIYTFGWNSQGQLGTGDTSVRLRPTLIIIP